MERRSLRPTFSATWSSRLPHNAEAETTSQDTDSATGIAPVQARACMPQRERAGPTGLSLSVVASHGDPRFASRLYIFALHNAEPPSTDSSEWPALGLASPAQRSTRGDLGRMPASCERESGGPLERLAGGRLQASAAKAPGASRLLFFGSKTDAFEESARPAADSAVQTVLVPASVSVFQKACVSSTTCGPVGRGVGAL